MDNYLQLIERIANSAGLTVQEIERKIEAKRAKLSGLVSKEGAAQIVAAELGINFDNQKMKISELLNGMKKANVTGKIIEIFPVREYNKNGKSGKVANLVIADESSNAKMVLWDTNHIALIETGKIVKGSVVDVSNGMIRNGEIHISSFSDIRMSKEKLDKVVSEKVFSGKCLKDAQSGQGMQTRAFIVQVFEPRYFEVCSECGKKAVEGECAVHGKVTPRKRALLNVVLDDGTETMRSVMFGENILKLGLTEEEIFSLELFNAKKHDLVGEEKLFSGNVRSNALYNTLEFNIDGMSEVDIEKLVADMQKS